MGNKRIYEVAKDYGKPVNEVIDLLKKNNIEKTNFSAADDKAMSVIRKAYDKKPEPPKPAKTEKRDVMTAATGRREPGRRNFRKVPYGIVNEGAVGCHTGRSFIFFPPDERL